MICGGLGRSENVLRIDCLVGGWASPVKNMSSSIGMIINPILMGKSKMATKPPTSCVVLDLDLDLTYGDPDVQHDLRLLMFHMIYSHTR